MRPFLCKALLFLALAPWVMGAGVLGVFLLRNPDARVWLDPDFLRAWHRVGKGMLLVHTRYIEPERATPDALAGRALGAVAHLDRYSNYLSPGDYAEFKRQTNQTHTGIGADVRILERTPVIVRIYPKGGAEAADLRAGDRILAAGDTTLTDLPLDAVLRHLRREAGVPLILTIQRDNDAAAMPAAVPAPPPASASTSTFTRSVTCRPTHIPTVEDIRVLNASGDSALPAAAAPAGGVGGGIGYARITEFKRHTSTELSAAIRVLTQNGAQALILDLRDNPGGNIESAIDTVGLFTPPNTLVTSLRGSGARDQRAYRTHGTPAAPAIPLAVLVNARTASSAEIVSGALQDHRRAVVIGTPTRGKHVVQTVFELDSGDGLRLTTAQYYLPSGRTIRDGGIRPDIAQTLDWRARALHQTAATWASARRETDFLRLHPLPLPPDTQLAAALDYLRAIRPRPPAR